ncbi:MAG: type I-E CRISPR-associated protein Cse2/CasB [Chloroflexi bacterium]|nr:type I-E CRISPR-associated protein Cse2/CasB [Chloroflexota bacterium]
MTEKIVETHPFIAYLQSLAEKDDRGALAALRRGLGQPPGSAAEMFRYVEPWLPERRFAGLELIYYLIASLFAYYPESAGAGNMGTHMRQASTEGGEEAIERRFTALLAADLEDLPGYLRQAVSFLRSKNVLINWDQLLRDIQDWDREDRRVQKHWASAFWSKQPQAANNANQ